MNQNEVSQKESKIKFLNKYKAKVIRRTEKDLELYKQSSPSYVFVNKIFNNLMDFLGWVLLIVALYLYMKSGRGNTLELNCHNLPQLAQACSQGIKSTLGNVTIGNLSIPLI